MIIPQFLRKTQLEQPGLPLLHETAVLWSNETFSRKGNVKPTWLLMQASGSVGWIETPWGSPEEKYMFFDMMSYVFHRFDVVCYCLVVEIYIAKYENVEPDIDPRDLPKPSQLPRRERDEALMVIGVHVDGGKRMTSFLVTPRRTGLPILGPRVDVDLENEKIDGDMFSMFELVKQWER